MKRAVQVMMLFAVLAAVGNVQAQTVRWTYVEGGGGSLNPDRGDREYGWLVGGAIALGEAPLHVYGEWGEYDPYKARSIGFGWHGLLGEKADLFADGAFYDADVEDGFKIRFGARWRITEHFELNGNLAWLDLDFSDNKSAAVNVIFELTDHFGVGGGIEWGDNLNNGRVFARFSWGE